MMRTSKLQTNRQRGFTLIELIVGIVIVGLLLAVAIPQYNASVLKAHRTDAKSALLDFAQREEKFYSVNNAYSQNMSDLYSGASGSSLTVQSGSTSYYTISATATAASSAAATAASFVATATATGTQTSDPCGNLTIDSTGTTSQTGGTQTTGCW